MAVVSPLIITGGLIAGLVDMPGKYADGDIPNLFVTTLKCTNCKRGPGTKGCIPVQAGHTYDRVRGPKIVAKVNSVSLALILFLFMFL